MGSRHFVHGLTVLATGIALLMSSQAISGADQAPDVVGKTFAEAKGLLGKAGMTAVVATVVGDRAASRDDCFVVSMTSRTPLDAGGKTAAYNQAQVNLNCYGGQADKGTPGYSQGNLGPDAVAVRATRDLATKKWKATPEGQKFCANAEAEHPEWVPIPDCHSKQEEQAILTKMWKATPDGQAWCAKNEAEHPESAPIADCNLAPPAPATPQAAAPAPAPAPAAPETAAPAPAAPASAT